MCRLQGYNIQKPIPGQHVCAVPALGLLPRLCNKSGGTSTRGADCGSTRAWPTVRRIRTRVSSSVPCDCRAVGKSSALYCKAAPSTPAANGRRRTSIVPQLVWFCLCLITLWQSWSLLIIIDVVFRKLPSIVLCLLTLHAVSPIVVCVIVYLPECVWFACIACGDEHKYCKVW